MNEKNAQLVAGMRDMIAFIEANDDFDFSTGESEQVMFNFRTWYKRGTFESQKEYVAEIARRLGTGEKKYCGGFFWFRHDFAPGVRFEVTANREVVCERVVTGKTIVAAQPEKIIPAQPEHEIELVEWRCAPSLADEPVSAQ